MALQPTDALVRVITLKAGESIHQRKTGNKIDGCQEGAQRERRVKQNSFTDRHIAARRTGPTRAVAPHQTLLRAAPLIVPPGSCGQCASELQTSSLLHVSAHRPYLNIAGLI